MRSHVVDLCKKSSALDWRLTTAWNPQANGTAEAHVKMAKELIFKLIDGKQALWHVAVPWAQLMLNNRLPDRLGGSVSPYEMYFVRPFLGFDSEEDMKLWSDDVVRGVLADPTAKEAFLGRVKKFYEEVLPYVNAEGEISASRMKMTHDRKNKNNLAN